MDIDVEIINEIGVGVPDIWSDSLRYIALAKRDAVDFIYNTAALEGNAMTFPEVQTLLDGITVGGHKLSDEHQILNQNKSVELLFYLLENEKFDLSKETLCLLQAEVARDEALVWGDFRDSRVNIGGTEYIPPDYRDLDDIFKKGIVELAKIDNVLMRGLSYFVFGAKNQFFFDGNKRVSRLMMNGILLSGGHPILNIKAKDKLEFNKKMIELYDTDHIGNILEYLVDYYIRQNKGY